MPGAPVTQGQFFTEMNAIRELIQSTHKSGRDHIDECVDKLERVFREHELEDQQVENRVLIIETERKGEKAIATRRGAIAGSVAAGLILTGFSAIKKVLGY